MTTLFRFWKRHSRLTFLTLNSCVECVDEFLSDCSASNKWVSKLLTKTLWLGSSRALVLVMMDESGRWKLELRTAPPLGWTRQKIDSGSGMEVAKRVARAWLVKNGFEPVLMED